MISARDAIFSRMTASLGAESTNIPTVDHIRAIHDRLLSPPSAGLRDSFTHRVEQAGGIVAYCAGTDELLSNLRSLFAANGVSSVVLESTNDASGLIVQVFLDAEGYNVKAADTIPTGDVTAVLAATDASITHVSAGFADSGAVLYTPAIGKPRALSMLPALHVCLLKESSIYPSMSEYSDTFNAELMSATASQHTIIGGPSKTADIEKTLVQGVHGPRVFAILILNDDVFIAID